MPTGPGENPRSRLSPTASRRQLKVSLVIAILFCISASAVSLLREDVLSYRVGQYVPHDIVSRVSFTHHDHKRLTDAQNDAWASQPSVFISRQDPFIDIEKDLIALPLAASRGGTTLPSAAIAKLKPTYTQSVTAYLKSLRELNLVIVSPEDRDKAQGTIELRTASEKPTAIATIDSSDIFTLPLPDESLRAIRERIDHIFPASLQKNVYDLTITHLRPTHAYDELATIEAKNIAHNSVPKSAGEVKYPANMILVSKDSGTIGTQDWELLKSEHDYYLRKLGVSAWSARIGVIGSVLILTVILSGYCARYQPKLLRNHVRAGALAGLLLAMLLITQLAGIGTTTLYFFGSAPTVLAALILTIAYDQRFGIGIGTILGILVTLALGQSISFFLILWAGVVTGCYLLDDIRTRSKLIEVGGLTGLAMLGATGVTGLLGIDPLPLVARDCLYSAAAGLAVGFIILGILPFIEKAFGITTSMTLLEWGDLHQPILRRLATEAPGTYNHSLQVANLAEAAAESIGAASLLCRVGGYYHDIGKIKKADYFVENQMDGENRHLNLSTDVSLQIIIDHVKDGIDLAREYKLPRSLFPMIQQHHGTTLVEFFYRQACSAQRAQVNESKYRYTGPKPRTREAAVLMLADASESACRAMSAATPDRIKTLVHELAMKRFLEGQFDECDLTMRDLDRIEQSLVKGLLGIYHGRIAYPSTQSIQTA